MKVLYTTVDGEFMTIHYQKENNSDIIKKCGFNLHLRYKHLNKYPILDITNRTKMCPSNLIKSYSATGYMSLVEYFDRMYKYNCRIINADKLSASAVAFLMAEHLDVLEERRIAKYDK